MLPILWTQSTNKQAAASRKAAVGVTMKLIGLGLILGLITYSLPNMRLSHVPSELITLHASPLDFKKEEKV